MMEESNHGLHGLHGLRKLKIREIREIRGLGKPLVAVRQNDCAHEGVGWMEF